MNPWSVGIGKRGSEADPAGRQWSGARLGRIWTGSAGKSIHPRGSPGRAGADWPRVEPRSAGRSGAAMLPSSNRSPETMASASRSGGCGVRECQRTLPPLPPPPSYGLRGGEHAEINRNKGKTLARVTYCQVKRHLLSGRWGRELPHPGPPGPPGPFRAGDDHPLRPFAMHRHKPPALSRKPLKCLVCPKPPLPPRAAIRTAIRKGHGD